MSSHLESQTWATFEKGPRVCHDCVFWQSPHGRTIEKARWAERMEETFGAWGTLYTGEGERLLGSIQYGPAPFYPRAYELPAGPPSDDAVLITCAYLVDPSSPWVMQSLFLAVIGEARTRNVRAIEAFGHRYPEGQGVFERFQVHRTVFPSDFLGDFGFYTARADGRVELARLELGGIIPVEDSVLSWAKKKAAELLAPAPVPGRF